MRIYHNPKCSKSRQTLEIIRNKTSEFEIIEYLKNPLTKKEITILLSQLKIKPLALVRTQEIIWRENYKGKELTDIEIINAMFENPKLIERPIIVKNNKAVIGRPPENVLGLFA